MPRKKKNIIQDLPNNSKKLEKQYEIIEINNKKERPGNSIWFGKCESAEICIEEFFKSRKNLKIDKVYFWKEKKEVYITFTKIEDNEMNIL